ncbi:MAG: phosphoesterase [Methanomicrobiaceae archaeon]|nr:phosphoesterase [Methanomicrobiaceae archaeon]
MAKKKNKKRDKNGFLDAINERNSHVVHLTHNDLDAAGCDSIHRKKFGDVFTIWSSVGKFSSNLSAVSKIQGKGDLLSISDLGYQDNAAEALTNAKKNGWKIEWRDHHRWSDEEISKVKAITDYLCVDTNVCATGIVARDLLPDDEFSKKIARVVCDYDLWKHNEPDSKILGEVCTKFRNLNLVRNCFTEGNITNAEILKIYKEISEEKEHSIKKSIKNTKIIKGRYIIAFAPLYGYPSETAHAIRDMMNTDIEVIVSETGKFSIRSVPPISHIIAKKFGGGGHPPAAGGSFKFSFADKMTFIIFKKSKHFQKLFDVAEKVKEE